MPSSSARSLDAVRTWSSAAVPEMVTEPVGASLASVIDTVTSATSDDEASYATTVRV